MSSPRWRDNTGTIPRGLNRKGARVRVRLRNGFEPPDSWEALTTRWTLTTGPSSIFDVATYRAEVDHG